MPIPSLTGFDALSQFLAAATARSVFLLEPGEFIESSGLIGGICAEASLTDLAERLGSEDPIARTEAFHRIAASEELRNRIAGGLGDPARVLLQAQTARLQELARGQATPTFKILFFGDIHDQWGPVRKIVRHEFPSGDGVALAVGDLETYKTIPARLPLLFSHGNHDDEAQLSEIRRRLEPQWGGPYPLLAGEFALIRGGLVVGAFSGIYEREYFEGSPSGVFPYFSKEDVARALRMPLAPDLFLSHGGCRAREGRT